PILPDQANFLKVDHFRNDFDRIRNRLNLWENNTIFHGYLLFKVFSYYFFCQKNSGKNYILKIWVRNGSLKYKKKL
ncbi:MAG: hypothetical protein ACFE78_11375, partial [Candidatus Hodarchaeota archaeon]